MNRRLYRCRHDKRIAGVASGLAEYFDLDVSLVRVVWFVSFFVGGVGLLLYIAMAIVVPLEPEEGFVPGGGFAPGGTRPGDPTGDPAGQAPGASPAGWHTAPVSYRHTTHGPGRGTTIFGMILILFGALALIDTFLPAWADSGRFLWPAFILGIGALLVVTSIRREPTEP